MIYGNGEEPPRRSVSVVGKIVPSPLHSVAGEMLKAASVASGCKQLLMIHYPPNYYRPAIKL